MTDEQLDRMVRDADPYRPDLLGHFDDAQAALLSEITVPQNRSRMITLPRLRRGTLWQVAGAAATAAVLIGVFAVSSVFGGHPRSPWAAPDAPVVSIEPGTPAKTIYEPVADSTRLVIDEPGWKATTVYGFATEGYGQVTYTKGALQLEFDWYPAAQYDSYYADRLDVSAPQSVQVDKWQSDLFRYSASDFAIMLRPRNGSFVEMRTSGTWTRAGFDDVVSHIKRIDGKTWLAGLPPEIVTPANAAKAAAKLLADVPLPPGFDVHTLNNLGIDDPYQFAADVTGKIGCGWIAEWERAKRAGDKTAVARATEAMRGSHQWKALNQIKDAGGWSQVFWEYADDVVAGKAPNGYVSGLGCA
jgi:hypothetical protein